MKRLFYYFMMLTMVSHLTICISSCDDFNPDDLLNPDKEGNLGNNGGNVNEQDSIMHDNINQIYKDKEDFQNIATEFMKEFKASDYENIMELAEYICKEYSEYDTEEVEEWFEKCLENLGRELESGEEYEIFESIYRLSAFKGKFTANKETRMLERTDAENLSLHVTDQNGNPCEVILSTNGNTKTIHCFESKEYSQDIWDSESGSEYIESSKLEGIEYVYVEIPENINIVLKQNGEILAEFDINTDLESINGSEFDLNNDRLNVNATAYFNGYTFNFENIRYENNKEAKVIFKFNNRNKTLLSAELTANPEISVEQTGDDYFDGLEDAWEEDKLNSKNNVVNINILNKLQITATCSNLKSLIEAFDDEWDEHTDSKVNRFLNVNVFFYGSVEPTATIKLESYTNEHYDEYLEETVIEHRLLPVIEFQDGSKNSLEDFFNADDFRRAIDAFDELMEEFEDLIHAYEFDF